MNVLHLPHATQERPVPTHQDHFSVHVTLVSLGMDDLFVTVSHKFNITKYLLHVCDASLWNTSPINCGKNY